MKIMWLDELLWTVKLSILPQQRALISALTPNPPRLTIVRINTKISLGFWSFVYCFDVLFLALDLKLFQNWIK